MEQYVEMELNYEQQVYDKEQKVIETTILCWGVEQSIYESRYETKNEYMMNLRARYLITVEDENLRYMLINGKNIPNLVSVNVVRYLDDSLEDKLIETYASLKLVRKSTNTFVIELGEYT